MRMNEIEEEFSDIEDKVMENNEAEQRKDRQLVDNEGRQGIQHSISDRISVL